METAIQKITRIVAWWEALPIDYPNLSELMHARQVLSATSFTFANDLLTARNAWATAKSMHEAEKAKAKVRLGANKTKTGTQIDNEVRANSAKYFEMEQMAEALYFGMKHQYDAIAQVLEAMAQRIAILRREWEAKNYANGI